MVYPEQQRRAYLKALGIDVWLPRDVPDDIIDQHDAPSGDDEPDWDTLEQRVAGCTRCPLAQGRTNTVFGVGDRDADWLIVGEAPGAEEDRLGEPFVGRAGKLLDEMLRALGQSRKTVFIANILKCRPPNNRDPKNDEVAACRRYLDRQIALIQPRIILAVGRVAAQNLLGCQDPVGRMRGRVHAVNGIPLVVTYHPAYLLRSPSQKKKSWQDLCLAAGIARENGA